MTKKIEIPKEELYQKYIIENMPRKECATYFNVSEKAVTRRLSEYGIKRDTKKTYENRKKAMLEKYGVEHPSQSQDIQAKIKVTMLERYGVEYTAQSPVLQQKMQQTMMQKYHKNNYVETSSFQEQSKKTCIEKYGVEYPCQAAQCRAALEEAIGHSAPEKEFASILEKYSIPYEQEYPLRGFKFDFKVGDILFEINPSATHNANFGLFGNKPKPKTYHYAKHCVAKEFGFHCVHVFDWDDKEKIVRTFLLNKERVFARHCVLKEVSVKEAKEFLIANHLQGYAKDEIRIGLYHNQNLIQIMTFAKPRYNKKYEYEIIRLCSTHNVVGGAEKILDYFVKTYNPRSIISYCDLAKFDGKIYKQLGFKAINKPKPNKHWVNLKTGQHITDNLLRQKGFDQLFKTNFGKGTSNEQLMLDHGFVEVFDCGILAETVGFEPTSHGSKPRVLAARRHL